MSSSHHRTFDFRRLLDQLPSCVCVIDHHDVIQYVNQPLYTLLHLSAEQMIGQRVQQVLPLIPASLLTASGEVGQTASADSRIHAEEWRYDDQHGNICWLRGTAQIFDDPVQPDQPHHPMRLLIIEDITPTRQLQMHLNEAQALLSFAIQNSSVVLFTIDVEGRIQHFEGRGIPGLVADPEAIIGQPLQDVYRLPELSGELAFVMDGHRFTSYHRLNKRDFITYYNPVTDLDDEVIRVMGLTVDITDQTAAYQLAREAELHYEMIFERVSDIVFITDQHGRFMALNPAFTAVTGYDIADWIGEPLFDLVNAEDQPRLRGMWQQSPPTQQTKTTGQLPTIEVRMPTHNGREINIEIRARLISPRDYRPGAVHQDVGEDAAGEGIAGAQSLACVGVARDITQRKLEVLQELQVDLEYERLEMLNRFIHNVSHDVRTPLSIINSAAYLIRRKVDDETLPKIRPHLTMIEAQVQHLNEQLNNLLTLPDTQLRRRSLIFTHYDLAGLLRSLVDEQDPAIQRRHQQIRHLIPFEAVMMYGMEEEIRRAVRNVLTNAITYTPAQGHILLRLVADERGAKITVRDSGIGIAAEDLDHIFQPFYRVEEARALDTGGMGLGLTVARAILEAHQGEIRVESAPDQGTTVTIDLPFLDPGDY